MCAQLWRVGNQVRRRGPGEAGRTLHDGDGGQIDRRGLCACFGVTETGHEPVVAASEDSRYVEDNWDLCQRIFWPGDGGIAWQWPTLIAGYARTLRVEQAQVYLGLLRVAAVVGKEERCPEFGASPAVAWTRLAPSSRASVQTVELRRT